MKKFLIIATFVTLAPLSAGAQTALKWNAIYWALGITNTSVETRLADKITFNADAVYSPWESVKGNKLQILQLIPEFRYYPKTAFDGLWFGLMGGFHTFDMTKWNYINKYRFQRGYGYAYGLSFGYRFTVSHRLSIDMYMGGAWQESRYTGYKMSGEIYAPRNGSGELLIYKLGAAVALKFGKKP